MEENQVWRPFQRFATAEEAQNIADWLRDKGLELRISGIKRNANIAFTGVVTPMEIAIEMPTKQMGKAREMLKAEVKNWLEWVPEDYFLLSFENHELVELVRHPEKWDILEEFMAEFILERRGINPWVKDWDGQVPIEVEKQDDEGYVLIGLWILLGAHFLSVVFNGIRLLQTKWLEPSELMVAMLWGVAMMVLALIRLGYVRKLSNVSLRRRRSIRIWVVFASGAISFVMALIASILSGTSPFDEW